MISFKSMMDNHYIPEQTETMIDYVISELHVAVKHEEFYGYYASLYLNYLEGIVLFRRDKFLLVNDSGYSMRMNLVVDKLFDGKVKIFDIKEYEYCTLIKLKRKHILNYLDHVYKSNYIYICNKKPVPFNTITYGCFLSYSSRTSNKVAYFCDNRLVKDINMIGDRYSVVLAGLN